MAHSEQKKIISNDEIDLGELFRVIARGWKIILVTTLFFVLLGGLYSFLKTPSYQSSTRIIPADEASLAPLNRFDSYRITPENAYYRFAEQVSSYQNFQKFVQQSHPDLGEVDELSLLFNENLTFSGLSNNQNRVALTINYLYPENVQGADTLNLYVQWTSDNVSRLLINNFIQTNNLRIEELENQRDLLKQKIVAEREDRIFELNQAIQTAKALGIEQPTMPQELGQPPQRDHQALYADIQSNDWQLPLYFMGFKVLQAEKATLQDELKDGLSSEDIRDLTQEIEERKNISGRYAALLREEKPEKLANIQVVNIVDTAYQPAEPIAPKKKIILLVMGVLGVGLGILVVLFRCVRLRPVES